MAIDLSKLQKIQLELQQIESLIKSFGFGSIEEAEKALEGVELEQVRSEIQKLDEEIKKWEELIK